MTTVRWYCAVLDLEWTIGEEGPRCDTYGETGFGIDNHEDCGEVIEP